MGKSLVTIFLVLFAYGVFTTTSMNLTARAKVNMYNLILFNSIPHSSFDPLHADYAHNRQVARMLYSPPLEISRRNRLESALLEGFSYDPNKKLISMHLREGLQFSDGTAITIQDVAVAILRLARKRPYFPTVRHISGLDQWLEEGRGLNSFPSGVEIRENSLMISLDKNVHSPLFRFTLEVFSVIPTHCIDLDTMELTCERPPESGYYNLASNTDEKFLFHRRMLEMPYGEVMAENIQIHFWDHSRSSTESDLPPNSIITGWESGFRGSALSQKPDQSIEWLPRSWFTTLILNSKVAPFQSRVCRQVFARKFREVFRDLNDPEAEVEGSLFTALLPGYLNASELDSSITASVKGDCLRSFKGSLTRWTSFGTGASPFRRALTETLDAFDFSNPEPLVLNSYDEVLKSFDEGSSAILGYSSGFWAQDPVGDLQMFFTPGLHPALQQITSDPELREMLDKIEEVPEADLGKELTKINRYLFDDARINVVAHGRRFYLATQDELMANPAFSLASPTPWQLFEDK